MNSRNEAKLSMYNAVLTHIEANTAITATVPAFATAATTLRTTYNNIVEAAQQERRDMLESMTDEQRGEFLRSEREEKKTK